MRSLLFISFLFICGYSFGQYPLWKQYYDSCQYHYYDTKDYNKAIYFGEQALPHAQKLYQTQPIQDTTYSLTLNDVALCYQENGDYSEAEKKLKLCFELDKQVLKKSDLDYIIGLNNLGSLLMRMDKISESEGYLEQAANLMNEYFDVREHINYLEIVNNLANVYLMTGRNYDAEVLLKDVLPSTQKNLGFYLVTANNLASAYLSQKKFAQAESLYLNTINYYKSKSSKANKTLAGLYYNLANTYKQQKNYVTSEEYFKQSLQQRQQLLGKQHPDCIGPLRSLADIYLRTKKLALAEQYLNEAQAIAEEKLGKEHREYTNLLIHQFSLCLQKKQPEKAESLLVQATYRNLQAIEKNFYHLSERDKKMFIEQTNYVFTTLLKHCFTASIGYPYAKRTVSPRTIQTLYNLQLMHKGVLLNAGNKVKKRILASKDTTLIKVYYEWQAEKNTLAKYKNNPILSQKLNVDSIEKLVQALEKQLTQRAQDFQTAFNPKPVIWQEVKYTLKPNTAAIEIVRLEYAPDTVFYGALILTPNSKSPEFIFLSQEGKQLENAFFTNYRRSIRNKFEDDVSYDKFWSRIGAYCKAKEIKTLYLSTEGIYRQLNPNVLQNPKTKQYVLDEVEVILTTNTKTLVEKKFFNPEKTAFLLGNPTYLLDTSITVYPPYYFTPLSNTAIEISNIEDDLRGYKWKNEVFVAENATEENLKKLSNIALLHIATHGFFTKSVGDDPMMRSGLVLAGASDFFAKNSTANTEDGILSAYEATTLSLDNTNLVVLSACETGVGQIQQGEGVYGLQRALQVAGAKTLMMSLWKVNDYTTQQLMNHFYKNYLSSNDINSAFLTAQKQIRAQFPQPYYWGAFITIN